MYCTYVYLCGGRPPRLAVQVCLYMDGRVVWGRVGVPAIVGHIWIWGRMREREDIMHCSSEPASADQLKRAVVSFSFFVFLVMASESASPVSTAMQGQELKALLKETIRELLHEEPGLLGAVDPSSTSEKPHTGAETLSR